MKINNTRDGSAPETVVKWDNNIKAWSNILCTEL